MTNNLGRTSRDCGMRAASGQPTRSAGSRRRAEAALWRAAKAEGLPASAQPMPSGFTLALKRSLGRRDARPTLFPAMPPKVKRGYSFIETARAGSPLPAALMPTILL